MIRYLPVLIELALLVYCLIDIIGTPEGEVRNLPKVWWIILIIVLPVVGGIAWLVAGRPSRRTAPRAAWPAGPTSGFPEYERPGRPVLGPDDDPVFLAGMDDDGTRARRDPPDPEATGEPDAGGSEPKPPPA